MQRIAYDADAMMAASDDKRAASADLREIARFVAT
jgi:hypothetical protein